MKVNYNLGQIFYFMEGRCPILQCLPLIRPCWVEREGEEDEEIWESDSDGGRMKGAVATTPN